MQSFKLFFLFQLFRFIYIIEQQIADFLITLQLLFCIVRSILLVSIIHLRFTSKSRSIQKYQSKSMIPEKKTFKEIPKGKAVIQILSDTEEELIMDQKIRQDAIKDQINQAILSKDLNLMKIAVFKSFVKQNDNITRESQVRKVYTDFFKKQMGINMVCGYFNEKINPIYGQNTRPVQNTILLFGVDFMDKEKLNQYLGSSEASTKVTRINDSSSLLQFNSPQEAAKFIKRKKIKQEAKNNSNIKIQFDGENVTRSWIKLEPYDLLFYKRQLQARYITTDEENNFHQEYKNRYLEFVNGLKKIQNFIIKPGTKEDTYYNDQMKRFQIQISQKRVRSRDKYAGAFQMGSSIGDRRMRMSSRDGSRGSRQDYSNNNRGQYRDRGYPQRQNNREYRQEDGRRIRGRNNYNNDQKERNQNLNHYQSQKFNSRANLRNNSNNRDQDYHFPQYSNQNHQNRYNNKQNYNNRQNFNLGNNDNQAQELSLSFINTQPKHDRVQKDISLSINQEKFSGQKNNQKKRKNSSDPQEQSISLNPDNFKDNSKRNNKNQQFEKSISIQLSYQVLKKSKIAQKNKQSQSIDLSLIDDQQFLGAKKKDHLSIVKNNEEQEIQVDKSMDITLPLDYFQKKQERKNDTQSRENKNQTSDRNYRFGDRQLNNNRNSSRGYNREDSGHNSNRNAYNKDNNRNAYNNDNNRNAQNNNNNRNTYNNNNNRNSYNNENNRSSSKNQKFDANNIQY